MDAPAQRAEPRPRKARLLKRVLGSRQVQIAGGGLIAAYLRLVYRTCSKTIVPDNAYQRVDAEWPVIIAMWHGQHLLMPFIRRDYHDVKVLVSRHRDGEFNALAAERLGVGTIRGSGDLAGQFHRKGGVPAFRAMLETLESGTSVALTADVPKVARHAGLGIVKLAALSGRPIVPVAVTTSRRIELNNWDRTAVNLPFGRCVGVLGDWVHVSGDADPSALEDARHALEANLNAATDRAYRIVDRRDNA